MATLICLYNTRFDHPVNRTYMEAVSFSDLLVKLGFDERIFILTEIFSDNLIFSNYYKLIRIYLQQIICFARFNRRIHSVGVEIVSSRAS